MKLQPVPRDNPGIVLPVEVKVVTRKRPDKNVAADTVETSGNPSLLTVSGKITSWQKGKIEIEKYSGERRKILVLDLDRVDSMEIRADHWTVASAVAFIGFLAGIGLSCLTIGYMMRNAFHDES